MRTLCLLMLLLAGCGVDSQLCSNCANVAGTYALGFDTPPASDACSQLGVTEQNGPLTVTQVGSSLHGSFANVPLDGTLTQDAHVTLSGIATGAADGGANSDTLELSGSFQQLSGGDAGTAEIVGTFSGQFQRMVSGQMQSCNLSANFTARR